MSRKIEGTGDPAEWMLYDSFTSTPVVHRVGCYICEDDEFARMGLPLCRRCRRCVAAKRGEGHIAADDTVCDECGWDSLEEHELRMEIRDRGEPMNEMCVQGYHADPDNSGQCICCGGVLDPITDYEREEITKRMEREERARRFRKHERKA